MSARAPLRFVAERLAGGGTSAFVAMFNHLLRQNDWARARLVPFAGRLVCIELESPALARRVTPPRRFLRIAADGVLEPAAPAAAGDEEPDADVRMHVRPSFPAAGALLGKGARGLAPHLRIDGDVLLADALVELSERMRWDPEEDLSRVTGDVFARRVGRGAAAARDAMRDLRGRVAGAAGRRFANATGTLVGRDELEALRVSLDALEERVSGLETKERAEAGASRSPLG